MIHKLIVREIEKHGGTAELAERLILHGRKPLTTWLVYRFCRPLDGSKTSHTLEDFTELTGMAAGAARYSFYRASITTMIDAQREESYATLLNVLNERYPYPTLWLELLRYAYSAIRRFAVELLVEQDVPSVEIADRLSVSQSTVYKIRKAHIARVIQIKGDNPNDTEYYK